MEFVANESKKVEIETSTGVYQRHAIQTHFVQIGENYIDLIERYVMPLRTRHARGSRRGYAA